MPKKITKLEEVVQHYDSRTPFPRNTNWLELANLLRGGAAVRQDHLDRVISSVVGLSGEHADAADQAFIRIQLQAIQAQVEETPFGPLKAQLLIPVQVDIPEGAREWGFDRILHYGEAQFLAPGATDIPLTNVEKKRITFPMKSIGTGYAFTIMDAMAARMANMPLENELALAAKQVIASKFDSAWLNGDASVGWEGFVNSSIVPQAEAGTGDWLNVVTTPAQIIADMHEAVTAVRVSVKENKLLLPDTIAMPIAQWAYISTTARSTTSETTILEYFLAQHPEITLVEPLAQLAGAGVGGSDRMMIYKRDPKVVVAKASVLFRQLPVQEEGFGFKVPCYAGLGGVAFKMPVACKYVDGIGSVDPTP